MKLGIITFHRPVNFGAVMQAVALSKKINNLGGKAEIIDYRNELQEASRKNNNYKTAQGIKNKIRSLLFSKINNDKQNKFDSFLIENSKLSPKVYDKYNINEANSRYDLFITGSDQVWNLKLTNDDYNYFLKFVKDDNKKVSYASSFGYSIIPDEYKENTIKYLNKYKIITTREKQGQKIIENLVNREAEVVLDPTLLLNKEEWLKLSKKPYFKVPKKYILLYVVSPTKEDYKIASYLSNKTKMKVILINYNMRYVFGMKNCYNIGPQEFLWLFDNANLIITNSFHGTAFSINFNKNFFVRLSTKANNGNSRIENIINCMNLKDRYINLDEMKKKDNIFFDDWKYANEQLQFQREKSIEILKSYINMEED